MLNLFVAYSHTEALVDYYICTSAWVGNERTVLKRCEYCADTNYRALNSTVSRESIISSRPQLVQVTLSQKLSDELLTQKFFSDGYVLSLFFKLLVVNRFSLRRSEKTSVVRRVKPAGGRSLVKL